jgi:3'(2'), 5'-bisphosphate nucleotidase
MMRGMSFELKRLPLLLEGAARVAREAGAEIMRIYERGFSVQTKDDHSPLTEADLASQRLIARGLATLAPDIPLLAEESSPAEVARRREWRTLWLVDPLDGTREFVKRNGEFTVNIALVHEHVAVLGLLYAPAHDVLYTGARGIAARRVNAGAAGSGNGEFISAARSAASPPRVLGSRSHRGNSLNGLLLRLGAHELLNAGSALKFGWLAEGRADLYPRFSPTSEWDTAAGQAIAEAAGAHIVDLDGKPLRYNQRDTLINPSFLGWADPSRDWLGLLGGTAT